jgi:hypothetical protein
MGKRMISRFEQQGIPNPGSARALDLGCECAVLDNRRGQGFVMDKELVFYITMGCPVHAPMKDTSPL